MQETIIYYVSSSTVMYSIYLMPDITSCHGNLIYINKLLNLVRSLELISEQLPKMANDQIAIDCIAPCHRYVL